MKPETISIGELLYEAEIQFTNVIEYGFNIEALSSENIVIPPAGARFDYVFQGDLRGPRLSGNISGTDYLYVRADGRFQLHIHAQITTEDGVNISFFADGVSIQKEGSNETQIRTTVTLFSSSPAYTWLNKLQVWALGTIDTEKGEVKVKAYAAG